MSFPFIKDVPSHEYETRGTFPRQSRLQPDLTQPIQKPCLCKKVFIRPRRQGNEYIAPSLFSARCNSSCASDNRASRRICSSAQSATMAASSVSLCRNPLQARIPSSISVAELELRKSTNERSVSSASLRRFARSAPSNCPQSVAYMAYLTSACSTISMSLTSADKAEDSAAVADTMRPDLRRSNVSLQSQNVLGLLYHNCLLVCLQIDILSERR
eukprot:SAG31_NODE_10637_length_1114_cov_1.878818_1_plen_214_part_10